MRVTKASLIGACTMLVAIALVALLSFVVIGGVGDALAAKQELPGPAAAGGYVRGQRVDATDQVGNSYTARIVYFSDNPSVGTGSGHPVIPATEPGVADDMFAYIHFEGWESRWDEWHRVASPTIHAYTGTAAVGHDGEEPPPDAYGEYRKGQVVEAVDLMGHWYKGRIIDFAFEPNTDHYVIPASEPGVSDDMYALIHFKGWDSSFDEWHRAASPTLHPKTAEETAGSISKARSEEAGGR